MKEGRSISIGNLGLTPGDLFKATRYCKYRKIPKISPGAYIFQRSFLRGLFLEGLLFGGAYLWRQICVSKSSGLALQLKENLLFLLCFTLYLRAISEYKAPGGLYMEGRFNGRFFAFQVWGAYIWRGLFSEFYGILLVSLNQRKTPYLPPFHQHEI